MDVSSPLTEVHYNQIQDSLAQIDQALSQAERATRAGVDVSAQVKQLQDNRTKLMAIKNVYFPGR